MNDGRKIEITPVSEDTIEFQKLTDNNFREKIDAYNKDEFNLNKDVKKNDESVDMGSFILNELFSNKKTVYNNSVKKEDNNEHFYNEEELDADLLEKTLSPNYSDLRSSIDEAMTTGEMGVIDNNNPVIEDIKNDELVTSTGFVSEKLLILGGIVIVVVILIIILLLVL